MTWYVNYYRCPACGHEWDSEWGTMCDEECPECDERAISPCDSEEISEDGERHD
ncbi:hypothetical protein [Roseospira marina]|uniref:hypothetical protein n=1 Tax=Roseospira marina TaxID=140057 RepID=UPI0014782A31|nr:hypothetical protein [Roseospira marina]MBB4315431.1 putative RNA-binding Zn-ribbon protein involved in translation (DUF1610 family) [Roseospira marina]MBB5088423.1 putative RNA-binding Zn-ribbon protein involved in translation (DUF1610 family) [Roseospira marina]